MRIRSKLGFTGGFAWSVSRRTALRRRWYGDARHGGSVLEGVEVLQLKCNTPPLLGSLAKECTICRGAL